MPKKTVRATRPKGVHDRDERSDAAVIDAVRAAINAQREWVAAFAVHDEKTGEFYKLRPDLPDELFWHPVDNNVGLRWLPLTKDPRTGKNYYGIAAIASLRKEGYSKGV